MFTIENSQVGDRHFTNFDNELYFLRKVLQGVQPRLQFQFNDIYDKCIGKSPVLTFGKITEESTKDDFQRLEFYPQDIPVENLRIPKNAKTILVFGKIGKFRNLKFALDKFVFKKFTHEPTKGMTENTLCLGCCEKAIVSQFNLKTGERCTTFCKNDIVDKIEFSEGIFSRLIVSRPICEFYQNEHSII